MLPLLKIAQGSFQNDLSLVTRDISAPDGYITVNLPPKQRFTRATSKIDLLLRAGERPAHP